MTSKKLVYVGLLFSHGLFIFLFPTRTACQIKEQIRQQAESALQTMTPDSIERKLKELGLTREEAIQRARELNISLDNYLQLSSLATPDTARLLLPSGARPSVTMPSQRPAVSYLMAKKVLEVPGFKGRRNVDSLLQPFGYDIFQYPASTFEPILNVATPPSYLLGPGDEVIISVWGETKLYYQLTVNREGNIIAPDVGPVEANGLTIEKFCDKLLRRMSAIYSGLRGGPAHANTFLDVSLGKLRTLQVFVLGEVLKPGGYTLSSMSTGFHALYLSGGPSVNGTLREVQVIRSGTLLPRVDVYDYIIRGDKSKDPRLQDGDIVFIKPAGKRTALTGNVVRPAIYELQANETLGNLIALSGGLRFDAYFNRVHIERIIPFEQRKFYTKDILDIDLKFDSLQALEHSSYLLEDGDVVTIFKISDLLENRVIISGNVKKPGQFQLRSGMRMRDLILEADSLQRSTFSERGTLFRLLKNLRREILGFNPRLALVGDEQHNLLLKNEDSVVIYEERQFFPEHTVSIAGAVRNPGTYPRNENMTVGDLVVLAGGLKEGAMTVGWELSRMDTTHLGTLSKLYKIDMPEEYWSGQGKSGFLLQDFDNVLVPFDPRYTPQKLVQITGYVMYPGTYAIRYEGERLNEIMNRCGGLRPGAYLEASQLIRRQGGAGMIPIDFKKALDDSSSRDNVVLYDGDSIYVEQVGDVVSVRGEVFVPSAVLYKQRASLKYYISQAGGFKDEADEGRVVVFLPGGKKWEPGGFLSGDPEILPGSSIYVPKKVEKEDKTLPVIRDMTMMLASVTAIIIGIIQMTK